MNLERLYMKGLIQVPLNPIIQKSAVTGQEAALRGGAAFCFL
jgi:hypothetical protein